MKIVKLAGRQKCSAREDTHTHTHTHTHATHAQRTHTHTHTQINTNKYKQVQTSTNKYKQVQTTTTKYGQVQTSANKYKMNTKNFTNSQKWQKVRGGHPISTSPRSSPPEARAAHKEFLKASPNIFPKRSKKAPRHLPKHSQG